MYREREEKVVRESTCEGKRERIATIRLEKVFVKNQLKEFFPLVCKGPALKAALRGTKKGFDSNENFNAIFLQTSLN